MTHNDRSPCGVGDLILARTELGSRSSDCCGAGWEGERLLERHLRIGGGGSDDISERAPHGTNDLEFVPRLDIQLKPFRRCAIIVLLRRLFSFRGSKLTRPYRSLVKGITQWLK